MSFVQSIYRGTHAVASGAIAAGQDCEASLVVDPETHSMIV